MGISNNLERSRPRHGVVYRNIYLLLLLVCYGPLAQIHSSNRWWQRDSWEYSTATWEPPRAPAPAAAVDHPLAPAPGSSRPDGPFLCSLTRVHNAPVQFASFVRHYLREGFDRLVFLDDLSDPPLVVPADLSPERAARVVLRRAKLEGTGAWRQRSADHPAAPPKGFYGEEHVRQLLAGPELADCAWVAHVDVDELLTTRRHPRHTVQSQLVALGADYGPGGNVTSFCVPWVVFVMNPPGAPPVVDLGRDMPWRWNHSRHHANQHGFTKNRDLYNKINVKTVFRPGTCVPWNEHAVECHGNVTSHMFNHFHEEELADAVFALHHYRYISREQLEEKCGGNYHAGGYPEGSSPQEVQECIEDVESIMNREVYDNTLQWKQKRHEGGSTDEARREEGPRRDPPPWPAAAHLGGRKASGPKDAWRDSVGIPDDGSATRRAERQAERRAKRQAERRAKRQAERQAEPISE